MAYTTDTIFELQKPHRDVSVWPGSTEFTQMIVDYSSEINDFYLVDSDMCTSTDTTAEAYTVQKVIGELLEDYLDWLEIKQCIPPTERVSWKSENPQPSLFDMNHGHLRDALNRRKEPTDDEDAYTRTMGMGYYGGGAELD